MPWPTRIWMKSCRGYKLSLRVTPVTPVIRRRRIAGHDSSVWEELGNPRIRAKIFELLERSLDHESWERTEPFAPCTFFPSSNKYTSYVIYIYTVYIIHYNYIVYTGHTGCCCEGSWNYQSSLFVKKGPGPKIFGQFKRLRWVSHGKFQ